MAFRSRIRAFATGGVAGALLVAAGLALVSASGSGPEVEPELASYMGELQQHTHKLGLSIQAENAALSGFYLDEVGEVVAQVEHLFPRHDGHPVADLTRAILDPELTTLRHAIESARWDEARSGLDGVVAACNSCHVAAGHAFIEVEVTTANPFGQSFAD